MIKEYKDNKEDFINGIMYKVLNKNYIHPYFLNDDLDYIASCTKASLNNFVLLKYKNYDKQTSLTTCMNKYLRFLNIPEGYNESLKYSKYIRDKWCNDRQKYLSWYESLIVLDDRICDNMLSKWVLKHDLYKVYSQKEGVSLIKHFIMCILDTTLWNNDLKYDDYITQYLPLYKAIYVHCKKVSFNNTKLYEDDIRTILSDAYDSTDFNLMDDKQIIKFMCNKIRWRFLDKRKTLDRYKSIRINKNNAKRFKSASVNIPDKTEHIFKCWFSIDYSPDVDIKVQLNKYKLNKNQIKFMLDLYNISKDNNLKFNKNKNGLWDLKKSYISDKLCISYDAFKSKCKRINIKINGKYTVNYNDNINVEFESNTHRITKDVYNEYWNEIYKQNEIDRMDRYVEREERDKDYLTITANRVKRRKNKC